MTKVHNNRFSPWRRHLCGRLAATTVSGEKEGAEQDVTEMEGGLEAGEETLPRHQAGLLGAVWWKATFSGNRVNDEK